MILPNFPTSTAALLFLGALLTGASNAAVVLASFQFTGNSIASGDAGTSWTTSNLGTGINPLDTNDGSLPLGTFDGSKGSPTAPSLELTMEDINDGSKPNDYYSFTITPDSGIQVDYTSLTFDFQKESGGANVDWEVRSSVDSFAATLGSGSISSTGSWVTGNSAVVTGLGTQSSVTEFRLYLVTTGTFGPNELLLDNLVAEGNVTAIPEPSTALIGLAGLGLLVRRRR